MKVVDITENSLEAQKTAAFVEKHGLLFSSRAWLAVYPAENIRTCALVNKNEEVVGCFIYYSFKKSGVRFVITPPFSPNSDLFYINPAESIVGKHSFDKEVLLVVAEYFTSLKVPYFNLNLPYHIVDTQPFTWKGFTSKTRYSYLIDLAQSEETIWNNLSSEKRKSINKAQKDGLVIEATKDYETVYRLILTSLERNDKDRNEQIIRAILFSFVNEQNAIAYVAYHNGQALGATFCVIDRQKAVYIFGGFSSDNKHHGAGVSCMWQSILEAKRRGLQYFDFEGSMNKSIERYFREFGGTLTPYYCVERIKHWLKLPLQWIGHKPM